MKDKLITLLVSLALVAGVFGVLPVPKALAATCNWTGTVNTAWANSGNWSCGTVPGSGDIAIIGPATNNPIVTANATVGTVTINNGGILTYNGGSGISFVITTFTINDGGKYVHNRAAVIPIASAGTTQNFAPNSIIEIQNFNAPTLALPTFGHLIVNNSVTLQFSGYLSTVAGDFTKQGSGELRLATTQVVNVNVGGNLSIQGGTITVQSSSTTNTAALTTGGSVSIGIGTTLQRGSGTGSWTFSLSGDWTNSGTFTGGTSTLTFNKSGTATYGGGSTTTFNNLIVNSGTTLDVGTNTLFNASGTVTNNGTLKQTKTVNASSTVDFLNVSTNKYYGVQIAAGGTALDSTTVAVSGNQICSQANGFPVKRCFEITPASQQSANIKFYFTNAEMQTGQTLSSLNVWHYNGSTWDPITKGTTGGTSSCGSGAIDCFVEGTGISSYSPFALKNTSPTGVTLADFSAAQQGDAVLLTWETNSELENRGFNLYRGTSPAGPDRQLNATLIPSQSQGNPGGFIYTWEDRADLVPGTAYFYWVQDVDIYNVATMHGPVSVDYIVPTAVTLSSIQATPAAGPAVPLAGALLALLAPLAGALAVRRRRA